MTAELTPDDLAAIKGRIDNLWEETINDPDDAFTAEAMVEVLEDARRLLDEVERLRGLPRCPDCDSLAIDITPLNSSRRQFVCRQCHVVFRGMAPTADPANDSAVH